MADPFTIGSAVVGGIGALGGLFKKKRTNPYSGQIATATNNLQGTSNRYNTLAGQAGSMAQRYQPQQTQSIDSLAALLRRRATGGDRAAYMSQQIGNQNRAGLSALSALRRDNALAGGANPYSAGQEAIIRGQIAANTAGAANSAASYFDREQYDRAAQLQQLLGGVVGQAQSDEAQFLGNAAGLNSNLLSVFSNMQRQQQAEEQARQQQLYGLLGNAAGAFGASQPGNLRRARVTMGPQYQEGDDLASLLSRYSVTPIFPSAPTGGPFG